MFIVEMQVLCRLCMCSFAVSRDSGANVSICVKLTYRVRGVSSFAFKRVLSPKLSAARELKGSTSVCV